MSEFGKNKSPKPWVVILGIAVAITSLNMLNAPSAMAGELPLAPALTHELNLVLRASDGLHLALIDQNDERAEISLRDVIWQLERARSAAHMAKPHERNHLVRILNAARTQLELGQTAFGDERRSRLRDAYNHLVNMVRIYRLDRSYSIFFCPEDRTTWVQKGAKGRNPFPTGKQKSSCGIRITK